MLQTAGIPMWVTIFALIVCVLGCALGVMALFGQGFGQGLAPWMSLALGGRTLGLGLAAGVAVLLKSPIAYLAAFVGGLGRDLGDLLGELSKAEPNTGVTGFIVVFLLAGMLGTLAAYKARRASH